MAPRRSLSSGDVTHGEPQRSSEQAARHHHRSERRPAQKTGNTYRLPAKRLKCIRRNVLRVGGAKEASSLPAGTLAEAGAGGPRTKGHDIDRLIPQFLSQGLGKLQVKAFDAA